MFRDGGGRGLLRQFLVGQIMPEGFGQTATPQSEITGQFGGGAGELAKAESNMMNNQMLQNANTGLNKIRGNVGQALGGNPQFSGWNFGALGQQMNPIQQLPQKESPWSDLTAMLGKKYGGY